LKDESKDFVRGQLTINDKLYIAAGSFPASVDQFAYNPGDGVLSFRGVPYAFITNIPQDFNVQDIVISPPLPDYSITLGY
jgi:hypothetical protein